MKISYKADYALKAVIDIAKHGDNEFANIKDIANRQDIPVKFLEHILLQLKTGDIVDSKRGVNGGYCLKKSAENIKMGEIIKIIDNSMSVISCIESDEYSNCKDIAICKMRKIYTEIDSYIKNILYNVSIKDLIENEPTEV